MKRSSLFLFSLLCITLISYAAPSSDAPANGSMGSGFDYEEAYGTYHWDTPAAFQAATGQRVGAYKEAPMLASRVASGILPPVEERLPNEPLVLGREIGTYGGTMFSAGAWRAKTYGAEPYSLYGLAMPAHTWEYDIYNNLAKSTVSSDGGRVWTIELREGTKWSNGNDFTVDDIIFWWENVYTMDEPPAFYTRLQKNSGNWKEVRRIDNYTFEVEYIAPSLALFYVWGGKAVPGFEKEYWSQFHPRYADAEELDALVKEGGFESWEKQFAHMTDTDGRHNTDRPILLPWVLEKGTPGDIVMTRNPYYWAVDPEGNQLPYIDELYRFMDLSGEVINLKALSGELDMAIVNMETFQLAKERESQGNIVGKRYGDNIFNAGGLEFNLTHKDPVLRALFRDKNFRFAASHAINREQINELVYFGISEPWQAAPWENSAFYHEGLAHAGLEYDPEKAGALFSEAGLKKGSHGIWTHADGSPLQFTIATYHGSGDGARIAELVTDDLKAIGLDVNLRLIASGIYDHIKANDLDAMMMGGAGMGGEGWIWTQPLASAVVPVDSFDAAWAPLWQKWYESNGEDGEEPIPDVKEAIRLYREGMVSIDADVLQENWQKIADIAAENLWTIGTVKLPGYYKIYRSNLVNWPTEPVAWDRGGDKGRPEILFIR